MKQFLIRYRRGGTDAETWHRDVAAFIAALDGDAELSGKISYRCMRIADSDDYLHIATPADEAAIKTLQSRDYPSATRTDASGRGRWKSRGAETRRRRRDQKPRPKVGPGGH